MKKTRILIAENKDLMPIVVAGLLNYDLVETTKIQQSMRMVVEDGIDLFVISVHFDESRALELVTYIRENAEHQNTPVLIYRNQLSKLKQLLRETAETWKASNLVSDYLEFENLAELPTRLQEYVESLLPVLESK